MKKYRNIMLKKILHLSGILVTGSLLFNQCGSSTSSTEIKTSASTMGWVNMGDSVSGGIDMTSPGVVRRLFTYNNKKCILGSLGGNVACLSNTAPYTWSPLSTINTPATEIVWSVSQDTDGGLFALTNGEDGTLIKKYVPSVNRWENYMGTFGTMVAGYDMVKSPAGVGQSALWIAGTDTENSIQDPNGSVLYRCETSLTSSVGCQSLIKSNGYTFRSIHMMIKSNVTTPGYLYTIYLGNMTANGLQDTNSTVTGVNLYTVDVFTSGSTEVLGPVSEIDDFHYYKGAIGHIEVGNYGLAISGFACSDATACAEGSYFGLFSILDNEGAWYDLAEGQLPSARGFAFSDTQSTAPVVYVATGNGIRYGTVNTETGTVNWNLMSGTGSFDCSELEYEHASDTQDYFYVVGRYPATQTNWSPLAKFMTVPHIP
jgi:hypothetical protein